MALRNASGQFVSVRIEGDDSSWKRAATDTDRSMDAIAKKAEGLGSKFSAAGKAILPMSAALSVAGGVAVRFATDFNRGMANVATLIPGNIARVNELKGTVQQMAIATGKSTDDLTDGLYQTLSAFGDTADTAKILEINAKAAAAGLAGTTDAINLTSAITKGYGDTTAAAVQKASDLALMTVRLGQTTFPELASSMGKVIPIAQSMGQSQEDLFAVFATATGVTGSAAEVATQYRGVLAALLNPTEDLNKLIKQQGFESGQAMLQQKGLVGTMQTVIEAADKSGQPLTKYIASIEAVPLALALAGPQAENFAAKQAELAKAAGTTDVAFREQAEGVNSTGFKWQQMEQRMIVFAQRVGDKLMPALDRLADWASKGMDWAEDALDWFTKLPQPVQDTALAVAALAAISGPALVAVGFGLQSIAGGITAVGLSSTGAAAGAAKFFGLLSGPVAIGLASVGAGFLAAKSDMDAYQKEQLRLNAVAQDGALNLTGYGKSLQTIPPAAAGALNAIGGLNITLDQTPPTADRATGAIGRVTEAAKKMMMTLPGVTDAGNVLAFFDRLEVRADSLADIMGRLPVSSLTDSVKAMTGLMPNIPLGLPPMKLPQISLKDIQLQNPDELAQSVQRWFDNVPVAETGLSLGQRAGKAIVSGLSGALDAVTGAVLGALQGGGNVLEAGAAALGSHIGAGIGGGIGNFFGGPGGKVIGEKIGAFLGSLTGKLFSGNDTKKAREQAAQMMGFPSLDALYNELRGIGTEGAALVHQGLNVIGKKDTAANSAWIASVRELIEEHKALAGVVADGIPEGARGFPTRAQLEDSAKAAGDAYAYMRDSGLYTADTLKTAWQQWQDALVASGDAGAASLQKLRAEMDSLNSEYDQVFGSIKSELENPEYDEAGNRVYGVIEAQGIARMEALDKEREVLQQKLDAEQLAQEQRLEAAGQKVVDVAATVRAGIAEIFAQAIEVPYVFRQAAGQTPTDLRTSYAALGGLVTPDGVRYFAGGGWVPRGTDTVRAMLTPGEFVLNRKAVASIGLGALSEMNAGRDGGGRSMPIVNINHPTVRNDGDIRKLAREVVREWQRAGA